MVVRVYWVVARLVRGFLCVWGGCYGVAKALRLNVF